MFAFVPQKIRNITLQHDLILPFYKQTFRNKPTFYFVHVSIAKFVVSKVKAKKFFFIFQFEVTTCVF